jgi:hypothetical protein
MDQPSDPKELSKLETELLKDLAKVQTRLKAVEMTVAELAKLCVFLWKSIGGEFKLVSEEELEASNKRQRTLDN